MYDAHTYICTCMHADGNVCSRGILVHVYNYKSLYTNIHVGMKKSHRGFVFFFAALIHPILHHDEHENLKDGS